MELETPQTLANLALPRWALQHNPNPNHKAVIEKKLKALGKNPDPNKVNEIIGSDCWTTPGPCDECGTRNVSVVVVGEPFDYHSHTAKICEPCMRKALSLFHV